MRLFWIALMIALLPVRGWVGDAMAVSMNAPTAIESAQTLASADAPCHDTAPVALAAHGSQHGEHGEHGEHGNPASTDHGHALCDVCNGPALTAQSLYAPQLEERNGHHAERVERFVSLLPRHLQKPPIA